MALRFGKTEKMACLEDVSMKGASGESLCLAHKYTTQWFIAGVHVSDDGYVLKVKGEDAYFGMPEGEELAALQAEGSLPAKLPSYSIPTLDHLMGYSLWIVLVVGCVWAVVTGRKRRGAALGATSPAPAGGTAQE
jgi:hypothetical protein